MEPAHFYFKRSNAIASSVMISLTAVLTLVILFLYFTYKWPSEASAGVVLLALFLMLAIGAYFGITGHLIPALRKEPVLIVDSEGITYRRLIRWENIEAMTQEHISPGGRGVQPYKELQIRLRDPHQYIRPDKEWYISLNRWLLKTRRKKDVDVLINVGIMEGDDIEILKIIFKQYSTYRERLHK